MPRTFLAIGLPAATRQALRRVRPPAGAGVRPVKEGQVHLTLHFLGDVPARHLPQLTRAVAGIVFSPFSLSLSGVGRFPPKGRASVLWAGVAPCPALLTLHATLARVLSTTGFPVEQRAYTPHVTLARLTPQAPQDLPERFLADHANLCLPDISVSSFVVYESQRHDGGSRHIPLVRVPAAGLD